MAFSPITLRAHVVLVCALVLLLVQGEDDPIKH
jgi:hypothetical protein